MKSKQEKQKDQDIKSNTTNESSSIIKPYRYGAFMSRFSLQYWAEWYKQKALPSSMYLILMQLRNGKYSMFTVTTSDSFFVYQKGSYMIDPDMSREDVHTRLPLLYYHQDCMSPFKIDFKIAELTESLKKNAPDIEKTINPQNIRGFISSQVIEKVLKGQELSDDIRFIRMLIIMNLLISGIVLVIFAKNAGWF